MATFGSIYRFKVVYYEGEEKKSKFLFSDSDDVFQLNGIPKTTTLIICDKSSQDGEKFEEVKAYLVGDELTKMGLRDLINEVSSLTVSKDKEPQREALEQNLRRIYHADDKWCKVFVNKNIDYFTDYTGRINIIQPFFSSAQTVISPQQLIDGKICPPEEKANNYDGAYLDLE